MIDTCFDKNLLYKLNFIIFATFAETLGLAYNFNLVHPICLSRSVCVHQWYIFSFGFPSRSQKVQGYLHM